MERIPPRQGRDLRRLLRHLGGVINRVYSVPYLCFLCRRLSVRGEGKRLIVAHITAE